MKVFVSLKWEKLEFWRLLLIWWKMEQNWPKLKQNEWKMEQNKLKLEQNWPKLKKNDWKMEQNKLKMEQNWLKTHKWTGNGTKLTESETRRTNIRIFWWNELKRRSICWLQTFVYLFYLFSFALNIIFMMISGWKYLLRVSKYSVEIFFPYTKMKNCYFVYYKRQENYFFCEILNIFYEFY